MAEIEVHVVAVDENFSRWRELLELITESFAYMDGVIDPPSSARSLSPDALLAKAGREKCFVALADGSIVGCIFAAPNPDYLYISKFAVRHGWQGKGVGRRLLNATETLARANGKSFLTLQTRVQLTANHKTFANFGFVETERSAHPGFDTPTSVTMRKDLP